MSTPSAKKMIMTDYFNPSKKKRRSNGLQAKRPRLVPEEQLEYEKIPICGVSVQLPQGLKPYPTQKLMMVRMLQSLDKQLNALIESPTGSGKTMALLASSCAWLAKYKEEVTKSKEECRVHGYLAFAQSLNDTSKTNVWLDSSANRSADLFPETLKPVKQENGETSKQSKPETIYLIDEMEEELNEDFYQPSTSFVFAAQPKDVVDNEAGDTKVEGCTCKPRIRVYYGTRTHRQIAQVVKEYGRLPFGVKGTLKHTILASREQSCINEDVRNSGDMTTNCKEKLKEKDGPSGCVFKQNINREHCDRGPAMRAYVNEEWRSRVWDMEDLVDALSHSKSAMCPYFASNRIMTMDADIIFCPYNYLIDPIIRSSSDVHLNNSIVILDEAHNIEDTCREAASFSFSENEAYVASKELLVKAKRFWKQVRPNEMYASDDIAVIVLDENSSTGDQPEVGDAEARDVSLKLREMADFAQRLYVWITELSHATKNRNKWNDDVCTQMMSWPELQTTMQKAAIFHPENSPKFKSLLSALTKTAAMGNDEKSSFQTEMSICKPLSSTIVTLEKFFYFSQFFSRTREFYKCNVALKPPGHQSRGRPSEVSRGGAGPTQMFEGEEWKDARAAVEKFKPAVSGYEAFVNLWCMMPSVVCEDALKDCRSVILASGTLCPTETFKTELGIEFKLHMEGDQVISKDRIFATAIAKGPRGNSLCAVYRNLAPQSPFYSELAQILLEVCQTVPKGVLCFVSSYRILDLLMQTLRNSNYMRLIEQKKVVIEEPRRSSDLALTMQKFDDAIESPQNYGWECDGALMIAVYRGKVSEGIDFTDDKARCVVCVGIPFPNTRDEVVVEKKKFNDENRATYRLISGDQWYSTQAYRALNQALGRCLRHKNDWGALLLVDERFVANARSNESQSESQKISKWVRENLRIHRGYREFKADLDRFVQMRLSIDADTEDVKDVKPFKPMPTLDDEERTLPPFSDVVDSKPPASANPYKPRVNPFLQ